MTNFIAGFWTGIEDSKQFCRGVACGFGEAADACRPVINLLDSLLVISIIL